MKHIFITLLSSFVISSFGFNGFAQTHPPTDSIIDKLQLKIPSPFNWSDFNLDQELHFKVENNRIILVSNYSTPIFVYQTNGLEITEIFIMPNDTVYAKIKEDNKAYELVGTGKDSLNTQFIASFKQTFPYRNEPRYSPDDSLGLMGYKDLILEKLKQKKEYLDSAKQKGLLSESLFKYYSTDIMYNYYYQLYDPIWKNQISEYAVIDQYIGNIKFNDKADIKTSYYRSFIANKYIRYYEIDYKQDPYAVYNNIVKNYTGLDQEFLVSTLIGLLAEKKDNSYKKVFLEILESTTNFKIAQYVDYINKAQEYYLKEYAYFPEDVLNKTYLLSAENPNDSLSLKDVLNKYPNQALYIDFWASWCGPCRFDMENSAASKQLLTDNNIPVLYFSIDTDKEAWLNASSEENIMKNQYLIPNYTQTPLYDYLYLNSIPRSVILDDQYKIKQDKAPRLHEAFIENLKAAIEGTQRKVVTFF